MYHIFCNRFKDIPTKTLISSNGKRGSSRKSIALTIAKLNGVFEAMSTHIRLYVYHSSSINSETLIIRIVGTIISRARDLWYTICFRGILELKIISLQDFNHVLNLTGKYVASVRADVQSHLDKWLGECSLMAIYYLQCQNCDCNKFCMYLLLSGTPYLCYDFLVQFIHGNAEVE